MKRALVGLPLSALWLLLVASLGSNGWAQAPLDTEAETKLVKQVIDLTIKAQDTHDMTLLLAQYSDDAMIDSKAARAKVSKAAFKEAVARVWQQSPKLWTEYSGLKISVADATHAVATGTTYIHLESGQNLIQPNEWKLEKRDGRWLIVETNYK